jgi:hypothetical protein
LAPPRPASARLKAGFNPDQPRDADGRWTDEGGADGKGIADKPSGTSNFSHKM